MKDFNTFLNRNGGVPKVSKETGLDRRILYKMAAGEGLLDMKIRHYVSLSNAYPDEDFSNYFKFLKNFGS